MRRTLLVVVWFACLLSPGVRADEEPATPPGVVEAARRPLPEIEGDSFRFAVLADTHASTEFLANGEVFAGIVKEVEARKPDLAVFVGDNVDGHVNGAAALEKNWEVFDGIAARLSCPYRLVVGNNDVFDAATSDIWQRRYGDPLASFRVGNARFVCLDGERPGSPGRIDERGLTLLKAAVDEAKDGEHLFVFTHRPWWRAPPSNWMAAVHPILARHPSAHVFAGHWHHYEKGNVRDGVQYTIVGPAGGKTGTVEIGGEFHAVLLVTVKGGSVAVEVVRDGKTLPDDVVTEDRCAELRRLEESLDADAVALTGVPSADIERAIRVENVLEQPLALTLAVTIPPGSNWRIEPAEQTGTVESGAVHTTSWRLALDGDPLPLPKIHATGRAGTDLVLDHEVAWPACYERRLEVLKADEAPVVDGVLAEAPWAAAPTAARFVTLRGDAYAARGTAMRALWTPEHLYVALECTEPEPDRLTTKVKQRDWGALTDDAVLLFLSVDEAGPICCVGATAAGVPTDFRLQGGPPEFAWNGPWEVAAKKGKSAWTLEMAVPWAALGVTPAAGRSIALGVYRHSTPGGRDLTGWTPPKGGRLANREAFGEAVLK